MANLFHTIHVWISDIKVDEKYYSFKYRVNLNGNELIASEFSDSHSRRDDIEDFKRALEDGWALEQVCSRLQFSY